MIKNFKVMVNGKAFQVEMDDQGGADTTVVVNGRSYAISLEMLKSVLPVVKSAPTAPAPHETPAAPEAGKAQPCLPALGNVLSAPMPGVILNVVVKAGDKVARGDMLCALEAMKMKNAIRSPREAVIASVMVQNGQKVAHGDVLFKFA